MIYTFQFLSLISNEAIIKTHIWNKKLQNLNRIINTLYNQRPYQAITEKVSQNQLHFKIYFCLPIYFNLCTYLNPWFPTAFPKLSQNPFYSSVKSYSFRIDPFLRLYYLNILNPRPIPYINVVYRNLGWLLEQRIYSASNAIETIR